MFAMLVFFVLFSSVIFAYTPGNITINNITNNCFDNMLIKVQSKNKINHGFNISNCSYNNNTDIYNCSCNNDLIFKTNINEENVFDFKISYYIDGNKTDDDLRLKEINNIVVQKEKEPIVIPEMSRDVGFFVLGIGIFFLIILIVGFIIIVRSGDKVE